MVSKSVSETTFETIDSQQVTKKHFYNQSKEFDYQGFIHFAV
jgi:hypothetical protein